MWLGIILGGFARSSLRGEFQVHVVNCDEEDKRGWCLEEKIFDSNDSSVDRSWDMGREGAVQVAARLAKKRRGELPPSPFAKI